MTEHAIIKIRQLLESDSRIRQLETKFNSNRTYSNFFELRHAKLRVGEDIDVPDDLPKMFLTAVTELLSKKKKGPQGYIVGAYKKGTIEVIDSKGSTGGAVRVLFGDIMVRAKYNRVYGSNGVVHAMVHNSAAFGPAPGLHINAEYGWQNLSRGISGPSVSLAFIDWVAPEDLVKELIRIGKAELPSLKRRYIAGRRS